MRNGKRLVQVDVRDICANLGRPTDPHQRVEVGTIHVNLSAMVVNDLADISDTLLEHTMGGWVGNHERGEFFLAGCRLIPEIVEVDISILIAGDDHHPHSCHNCAGGIGSVRGRRDQADITVALPIGFVKCPDTEEPGIFAL